MTPHNEPFWSGSDPMERVTRDQREGRAPGRLQDIRSRRINDFSSVYPVMISAPQRRQPDGITAPDPFQVPEKRVAVPGNRYIPGFTWKRCSGNMAGSHLERAAISAFEENRGNSGRWNREFSNWISGYDMFGSVICGKSQGSIEL